MAIKITYTQQGDYLLPDLKLPKQPKVEIGIWGKRHLRYLKNHHPIIYTNLLTSCKITAYLADIDEEANEMFDRLVKQLAEQEGVTEKLKAENQILWVRKMNPLISSCRGTRRSTAIQKQHAQLNKLSTNNLIRHSTKPASVADVPLPHLTLTNKLTIFFY